MMAASLPPDFTYNVRLAPGQIRLLEIITEQGKLHLPTSISQQHLFYDQDALVLHMHIAELNGPPLYDALSYTWGNPLSEFRTRRDWEEAERRYSSKLPIICDNKLVYIGFSLHEALAGLRKTLRQHHDLAITPRDLNCPRSGPRPLVRNRIWIDALCINQSDLAERNAQVKIMHKIYQAADAVLIWLGPQDEVARQAVRAMVNLSMAPQDIVAQTIHLSEQDCAFVLREAGVRPIPASGWRAMVSLLHRRWFQRAWVIQEVAWARIPIIICDERLWIDMNVLLSVSDWMVQNRADRDWWLRPWRNESSGFQTPGQDSGYTAIDRATRTIQTMGAIHHEARTDRPNPAAKSSPERRRSFLELLVGFWESQCAVPHDKVYALRSLCWDQSLVDSIPVDYSMPVEELYTETAKAILGSTGKLDVLFYSSGKGASGQLQVPSWVPDWSRMPDLMPITHRQGPKGVPADCDMVFPFCADGNHCDFTAPIWAGRPLDSSNGRCLAVQGIRVSSIKTSVPLCVDDVGVIVPVLEDIPLVYSYLKPVPRQPFAHPHALQSGKESTRTRAWARSDETRSEVLWRTAVADVWKECHPAPDEAGLAFVRFLAHELGLVLRELEPRNYGSVGDVVDESKLKAERKRVGLVTLLRFLSGDEQRCLEEYYQHSSDDAARVDMLVTQPRRYTPQIDANSDISALVHAIQDEEDEDISRLREYMSGSRSVFSTEHGKLGLGQPSAQCGDEVWVLNGGKSPFLLRQRDDGTFTMVGAAYVHGIMQGQAVGYARGERLPLDRLPTHDMNTSEIFLV